MRKVAKVTHAAKSRRPKRATIGFRPDHWAKLKALQASRGEKGYSPIIEQALEVYFASEADREKWKRDALALEGSITDEEAEEARQMTAWMREHWNG
jgi:hypothetical protein